MNYKSIYLHYMDKEGIKYSDINERTVKVSYSGDNIRSIPVYVFFDKKGDPLVQLACWEIVKFPEDKVEQAYKVCNDLNAEYRWVKFSIDSDRDIRCSIDAYIDADSVGVHCANMVRRMIHIIDDAYPTIMKAMWG